MGRALAAPRRRRRGLVAACPRRGALAAARALLVLSAATCPAAIAASSAAAQQPAPGPPATVDGPSADIVSPAGLALSVARDGSGGLVYLKRAGGVPHVFVSTLASGSFHSPVEVDGGLGGSSSQPVIATGNGGLVLIAFINGGELYVVQRPGAAGQFGSPIPLAGAAGNPAIASTNSGKAYLAFTVVDGAGHDVRSAFYNGSWAIESPPLNAVAADSAGTGGGRPAVAAAGDGVGIVVWGEGGHVYSRRVWGTSPSVVDEQADAPPSGCTEASADQPVVGAGGDSSYAPVAFREMVTCGGVQQSRVLTNRLHASAYDGITAADGLSGTPGGGAGDPQITVGEYGHGWITSERLTSNDVFAGSLGENGSFGGTSQINGTANVSPPYPVPATAGLFSNLIAWQQEPGSAGGGDIRLRYAPASGTLGPETVVSSPSQGPTDAADGLAAAGDVAGDVAVSWLQGPPGSTQVMIAQLYQPPGAFPAVKRFQYATTSQPVLRWTAPREPWGPLKYALSVDGNALAQTYSTSAQLPAPLPDGPHRWQVIATNPAGLQSAPRPATVFVDTVAPMASLRLVGRRLIGGTLRLRLSYADLPPTGEPRSDASRVAKVVVRWGDGSVVRIHLGSHRSLHAYRRPGRYRITLVVADKAGNTTRVVMSVKVPKPGGKISLRKVSSSRKRTT